MLYISNTSVMTLYQNEHGVDLGRGILGILLVKGTQMAGGLEKQGFCWYIFQYRELVSVTYMYSDKLISPIYSAKFTQQSPVCIVLLYIQAFNHSGAEYVIILTTQINYR